MPIFNPSDGGGGLGTVTQHIVDATLSESGYNDNVGAPGIITFTASDTPAVENVVKRVDSFEVRLKPAAGKTINWSGGVTVADKYLRLLSDGAEFHYIIDTDGNVQRISEFGDLEEQL